MSSAGGCYVCDMDVEFRVRFKAIKWPKRFS